MIIDHGQVRRDTQGSVVVINKVLRNTYMLLSLTLIFSAITAMAAMAMNVRFVSPFITLIVYFGLLFFVTKTRNSAMGLVAIFALTGFLGFTLGPLLNAVITHFSNGAALVAYAAGGTGVIFLSLSALVLMTGKDFSHLGKFLFIGILVAFIASLANLFFKIPALHLAISTVFMILMCGVILYETSRIVHGGETNYIMATLSLYIALYNLFVSLLQILMVFAGRRD